MTSFYLSLVEDKNYGPFSVSRSLRRKYVSTNLIFVTFLKLCDPALALLFTTVYRVSTIQTALHCLHSSMYAIAIILLEKIRMLLEWADGLLMKRWDG